MIKDLRMMRRGVDVTVVVGKTKFGGDVTAKVTFSRSDLAEVLAPLEALALEEATRILSTSVSQQEVDERVAAEVAAKVEPQREAYRKRTITEVESLVKGVEAELVLDKKVSEGGLETQTLSQWRVQAIARRLEKARELVENLKKAS